MFAARLKALRIDVYQFHRPDPNVLLEESIGALADLQRGREDSPHRPVERQRSISWRAARRVTEIVSVQNRYNLTDRGSDAVLAVCERGRTWGFISVGAGRRRLTGRPGGAAFDQGRRQPRG